jgi:hypothetical protein
MQLERFSKKLSRIRTISAAGCQPGTAQQYVCDLATRGGGHTRKEQLSLGRGAFILRQHGP